MAKVLGVGWAKTGTTSLGRALEILGYDHVGQRMDLVEAMMRGNEQQLWDTAAAHDAFEDWPWILVFRQFYERFPDARFILTCRAEQSWLTSYRAMLDRAASGRPDIDAIRRFIYGFDVAAADDEMLLARVRKHNEAVRSFFADKPDRLITVDWAAGDGWAELCHFLGKPVPSVPFPHENRRTRPASPSVFRRALHHLLVKS